MKKEVLICLCLLAFPAFAQPLQVRISPQDCHKLTVVPATYVPGVSATGQNVAPADLGADATLSTTGQNVAPADINGAIPMNLPDLMTMTLPVSIYLEKDFPFWNSDLELGRIPVATVEIKNGQVFVNGVLASENSIETLKNSCVSILGE